MGWQPLSLVEMQDNPDDSSMLDRHKIRLRVCHNCCHVWNSAFDSTVEQYSGAGCRMYNNGSNWVCHTERIKDVLDGLKPSCIVEIGAGDCSFLNSLDSDVVKIAVDPCEAVERAQEYGIKYYREYFKAEKHIPDADTPLIVMRHLLEHMESPRDLLESIVIDNYKRADRMTWLYIEVPCATKALQSCRIEDWTYEHPHHFTGSSMRALLRSVGITGFSTWTTYGEEVLCCVCQLSPRTDLSFNSDEVICNYDRVHRSIMKTVDWFEENLDNLVFWGGAGKSAMFLNLFMVNASGQKKFDPYEPYKIIPGMPTVVDSHDVKWNMYVPGTRIRIQPPSVICRMEKPPTIIATTSWRAEDIRNEIIRDEIPCERLLKFSNGQLVEVPIG